MKVLFISRVTLPEGVRGNAQYTLYVIRQLKRLSHDVRVLITEGLVKTPEMWDGPLTNEESEKAVEILHKFQPDMMIVNYTYMCPLLKLAPDVCKRVVLTHDARHLRCADFMQKGLRYESSPWSEKEERAALQFADLIIAIQQEEEAEFSILAPHAHTCSIPCAFEVERLPLPEKVDSCIFVGSDADHNLQGILWFMDSVWTTVLKECPGASLDICGTVNVRLKKIPENVRVHGHLEKLYPIYKRCAVGIAPLLSGSGCKLKLIEALSMGRSCVSTPVGVSGLPLEGIGVEVAETADDFAIKLISLLKDKARQKKLAQQGIAFVKRNFDQNNGLKILHEAIQIR